MTSDLKYCSNYSNNNVLINEHSPDRQWSLDWKCKHYLFCANLLITTVKTKEFLITKEIYITNFHHYSRTTFRWKWDITHEIRYIPVRKNRKVNNTVQWMD